MLKRLKEKKNAGFTLAELLIVVAIIAVLAAVAIPIFTAQLNKSKAATDMANIRAGYADVSSKLLMDEIVDGTYYLKKDGTVDASPAEGDKYKCKGAASNVTGDSTVGGVSAGAIGWTADKNITYTTSGGKVTDIKYYPTTP